MKRATSKVFCQFLIIHKSRTILPIWEFFNILWPCVIRIVRYNNSSLVYGDDVQSEWTVNVNIKKTIVLKKSVGEWSITCCWFLPAVTLRCGDSQRSLVAVACWIKDEKLWNIRKTLKILKTSVGKRWKTEEKHKGERRRSTKENRESMRNNWKRWKTIRLGKHKKT